MSVFMRCFFSTVFSASVLLMTCAARAEDTRDLIAGREADATLLGRHWAISGDSAQSLEREGRMVSEWRERLKTRDFAAMTLEEQIDFVLLRNDVEVSAARLEDRKNDRQSLAAWLPQRETIDTLTDARVRGVAPDAEGAAKGLGGIPKRLTDLREKMEAAKKANAAAAKAPAENAATAAPTSDAPTAERVALPEPWQALAAARVVENQAEGLDAWRRNYTEFVPGFSWWVQQPCGAALTALKDYAKFLREEFAGVKGEDNDPLVGHPIGAEALARELRFEFIPYSAEELLGIADREFAWCEARMKEAARDMGLGEDWKAALEKVKAGHGAPGTQEAVVREEALEMIAWLKERDLVTIPPDCEEWWGTRMLEPREQRSLPFAAYGGHDVVIAYAAESMPQEDKEMAMRGNSRPFLHTVIPHELIPGHHLQAYMSARHRPWRGAFRTPFFVEGWALHWEMLLWDSGWHRTPEQRVGALFWRMHRCARIIVTLGFHLGKMKPEEMIAFLTDRVGHEKSGATGEVRRFISGSYPPLYQCAYMLGGLQLRALYAETVQAGKMTAKAFHDSILQMGAIPVELIRAQLLKLPLRLDQAGEWRFDTAR